MNHSIAARLMDKKLADARHALSNLSGRGSGLVHSGLVAAAGRIKHLEAQLAATETMRDRIAMQLLPGIQDKASQMPDTMGSDDCIRLAYHQADKVLEIRTQGSAGVPGETTSPENSICEYEVGDKFRLAGGVATITDVFTDDKGVRYYDFASKERGYEGNFTAADIASHQETYGPKASA